MDDAVVDVEKVFRQLKENREAGSPRPVLEVVVAASQEVRSGIIYATIIVVLVFLPLFALQGIEGKLFAPLGVASIVSILGSLVTSVTVTPVLCYYLIPGMRRLVARESLLVWVLKWADERLLRWSFDKVERQVRVPQLQLHLDYDRAALYGVTPAALADTLEKLSNGKVVSQVVDGQKRFDVGLRLSDAGRTTDALAGLLVETPKGRVLLRTFADVEDTDGPNQVLRENGRRRILVQANTDGSDMGAIVGAIRAEAGTLALPSG